MKKLKLLLFSFLVMSVFFLYPEVKNVDKPLNGEFHFQLSKIWETKKAGEDSFARIRQILVAEDGAVYVYDKKNMRYYIFDKDGQFTGAFGRKGEGPGEIRRIIQAPMFLVDNKIIIQDSGRLHYFNSQGKFIKSVLNSNVRYLPSFFLNENEFITAPRNLLAVNEDKGKIRRINLKTGQQKVISEFLIFEGGTVQTGNNQFGVVHVALTPMMIIGYHNNRLYFGKNDFYKISITDMDGKVINAFSLKRERRQITDEVKKERLFREAKGRAPKEVLEQLAKRMPNDLTYFSRIEVHNGFIYVFLSYYNQENKQQIDIFSAGGNYLYRAYIKAQRADDIILNSIIKEEELYLALENKDGEQSLAKFKIILPKNSALGY
ncbi:MAG: 6-bladed beta-propeller [Candidatus Aminicenantes bacterium]|nr:MAG: 6-bladed beta-propeller [Candidatus Aminicenantes bacterium]